MWIVHLIMMRSAFDGQVISGFKHNLIKTVHEIKISLQRSNMDNDFIEIDCRGV